VTGSAALEAEVHKKKKYSDIMVAYTFVPVVIETLGAWGNEAQSLASEIGRRLILATGEQRGALFL